MTNALLPGFSSEEPRFSQDYYFSSLTYEIRDKSSPLRHYFDSLVRDLRGVQRDYRAAAGTMLVGWSAVSAGTLGAAFDFSVRFRLCPALVEFLERIACRSVDIAEERARVRFLLSGEESSPPHCGASFSQAERTRKSCG